jgi:hypothetical protein
LPGPFHHSIVKLIYGWILIAAGGVVYLHSLTLDAAILCSNSLAGVQARLRVGRFRTRGVGGTEDGMELDRLSEVVYHARNLPS